MQTTKHWFEFDRAWVEISGIHGSGSVDCDVLVFGDDKAAREVVREEA